MVGRQAERLPQRGAEHVVVLAERFAVPAPARSGQGSARARPQDQAVMLAAQRGSPGRLESFTSTER